MTDARAAEHDYQAIEAAVLETERGRWFLAEHARRNRHAETAGLLDAIARLEANVARDRAVAVAAAVEAAHANDPTGALARVAALVGRANERIRALTAMASGRDPLDSAEALAHVASRGFAVLAQALREIAHAVGDAQGATAAPDAPRALAPPEPPRSTAPRALAPPAPPADPTPATARPAPRSLADLAAAIRREDTPPRTSSAASEPPPLSLADIERLSLEDRFALFT